MKIRKNEFLFYVSFTAYYILNMLYTTRIGNLFGVITLNDFSFILTPMVFILGFLAAVKSINFRHWILFASVFGVAFIASYNSGARAVLITILFIICGRKIVLEDFFRYAFKLNTIMIVLIVIGNAVGLIAGEQVIRGEMVRYSLGFASSNTLAMTIFKSVLLYYVTKANILKTRNILCLIAVVLITYYMTGSRLFALTGIIFFLLVIYERINSKAFTGKIFSIMSELILPALTAITLYFGSVYWLQHDKLIELNELFSGRLYFINYFLTKYGITPWGQRIEFTTVRESMASGGTWFALDNSYAYALICYGGVFFAFIALAYSVELYALIKSKKKEFVIYLICMLFIGLTENGVFDITFNLALMYLTHIFSLLKKRTRDEVMID